MTIYRLFAEPVFPDPEEADPDGLLAIGGDLSPERLTAAYARGIFPWYSTNSPILWWSPDPRMVLEPRRLHVPGSLKRVLNSGRFSFTLDSAFGRLVSGTGEKLYSITRKNERRAAVQSTTKTGKKHLYSYKSLAPGVKGRHMEALVVQLLTATEKEVSVHDGEEFVFVLDGTVLLEIGGERFELEPGDSAYYLSTTPHLIAAKKEKATILAVLYQGC